MDLFVALITIWLFGSHPRAAVDVARPEAVAGCAQGEASGVAPGGAIPDLPSYEAPNVYPTVWACVKIPLR